MMENTANTLYTSWSSLSEHTHKTGYSLRRVIYITSTVQNFESFKSSERNTETAFRVQALLHPTETELCPNILTDKQNKSLC